MSRFTIRPAVTDDSEAMRLLSESLLAYLVQGEEMPEPLLAGFTSAAFAERVCPESGYSSFVAESASGVVGFISMRGDDYLYHLFVAEGFHRQGIARRLWQHVTAQSRAVVIDLRSSLFAMPVYQKLGFEISGAEVTMGMLRFQPMSWQRPNPAEDMIASSTEEDWCN